MAIATILQGSFREDWVKALGWIFGSTFGKPLLHPQQ
jgi:hypothetical protein